MDTLATSTPSVEPIPLVPSSIDSTTVALDYPATSSPHLPYESPPTAPSQLSPPSQTLRRSIRVSTKPSYLQSYYCNQVSASFIAPVIPKKGTSHPIQNFLSYSHLSPSYKFFCNSISSIVEPSTYTQAVKDPKWREAMATEIAALEANQTWSLTFLPPHKQPIGCQWVYKVKYKADGTIARYKARLVAKGFTQREGLDYTKNFLPSGQNGFY